jgi:outer membrane protein TolC
MTNRVRIAACLVTASLLPAAAGAQSPAAERLTLAAAVQQAVDNNRQVETARLQVEKAEADLATARTRRLPVFETEVSASQLLTPVDFAFPQGAFGSFPGTGPIPAADTTVSVPRQPTAYVSGQVSQPLTQQVRIGLGIKSAAASREIEQERVRGERLAVAGNVKRLYFSILQTESALAANEEALTLYRELDRTLSVRVAQKVALRSDSLDVQLRLAQAELARTTYENTRASQKEQLNQLLGRPIDTAFEVEDVADATLLEVDRTAAQATARASRPDVREAQLRLQQAELDQRIARADRLPDVSLALSYTSNFNIDMLPRNLASLGVQMTWEPFDWGRRRRAVAVKTHAVQQARLGVRDAEDRSALEINSRLRTLAEKRAALQVARTAQGSAREKLRVATNQFQLQAALLQDVLTLRAELAGADDDYQQARLAFWTAKVDFEQAVGEDVIP